MVLICLKLNPLHPRVHCSKFYSLARWFWKSGVLNFGNIFSLSLYYFPLKKDLALHCTNWNPFQTFLRNSISNIGLNRHWSVCLRELAYWLGRWTDCLPPLTTVSSHLHDTSYLKQRKSLQHGPPIPESVTSLDWTGIAY